MSSLVDDLIGDPDVHDDVPDVNRDLNPDGRVAVETIGTILADAEVSARMLASAWLRVAPAASDDEGHGPQFYKAINVEIADTVVSLSASDGYTLATATMRTVDYDRYDVDLDVTGYDVDDHEHRIIVGDAAGRGLALMKFLAKSTKAPKMPDVDVRLTLHRLDGTQNEPALAFGNVSLERTAFRIEAPGEVVTLPVIEGRALDPRPLLADPDQGAPVSRVKFRDEVALKFLAGLGPGVVDLSFVGEKAPVRFAHHVEGNGDHEYPVVRGLVMPL